MRWNAYCPAVILLVITLFVAGCNTPCRNCGSTTCRTPHTSLRIVDQKVKDDKGSAFYSSYHGFRTEVYAMWRGKNASAYCRLLGDGTNGLAIQRKYLIDNKPVRFEGMVVGNPMILILEEYDPQSGKVIPPPESDKMTHDVPRYIHQDEGRAFFESFIKKYGLEKEPKPEGTKTAVDSIFEK